VHGFNVQATIGQLRMAGGARCPCFLPVSLVASKATEPFVDAHSCAIVARADIHARHRRVALVAEGLAYVWADLYRSFAVAQGGQGKLPEANVLEFSPVEERKRRRR